ncbi:MAG TPA: TetR/AcrR family transcriptional regulator [Jatrophihabitantaceae bacterium]|nr:TetR/AcrR family transcriptional regulator [Jatrophihabitantaceae bacterium]
MTAAPDLPSGPYRSQPPVDDDDSRDAGPRIDRLRTSALQAAIVILTTEGWDAVTQARVAKQSGVGRATVYRYWPDRTSLVSDAVLSVNLSVRHEVPITGDIRADLIAELKSMRIELTKKDLAPILAALIDRAEWEPDLRATKVQVTRYAVSVLRMVIANAAFDGQLPRDSDIDAMIALFQGALLYRRLVSDELISDEFIENLVDLVLTWPGQKARGLRRAGSAAPAARA